MWRCGGTVSSQKGGSCVAVTMLHGMHGLPPFPGGGLPSCAEISRGTKIRAKRTCAMPACAPNQSVCFVLHHAG